MAEGFGKVFFGKFYFGKGAYVLEPYWLPAFFNSTSLSTSTSSTTTTTCCRDLSPPAFKQPLSCCLPGSSHPQCLHGNTWTTKCAPVLVQSMGSRSHGLYDHIVLLHGGLESTCRVLGNSGPVQNDNLLRHWAYRLIVPHI